jgi:hypothetical protein
MNHTLATQLLHGMKRLRIGKLTLALALSVGVASIAGADNLLNDWLDSVRVEGTWYATETCCDGADTHFVYSLTFMSGADFNSGPVIHSDSGLAAMCMNTQGQWQRTGKRTFIATYQGYCANTATTPASLYTIKFNAEVTLDQTGQTFEGKESITILNDAGATTSGPFTGTLKGARAHAEAP